MKKSQLPTLGAHFSDLVYINQSSVTEKNGFYFQHSSNNKVPN